MRIALSAILMIFSVQFAASQTRPTAAERMEAHDKRTANQARAAGTLDSEVRFPSATGLTQKKIDSVIRKHVGSLVVSQNENLPIEGNGAGQPYEILRLFETLDCAPDLFSKKSDLSICNMLLEGESGRYYSFRTKLYGTEQLSDIQLLNGEVIGTGYLNQSMFVDLGPISISSVTSTSPLVSALHTIPFALSKAEFDKFKEQMKFGTKMNGLQVFSKMKVKSGHTYLARFIAYRSNLHTFEPGVAGGSIFEDDRDDIVIVFHVVATEKDGGATLIWHKLAKKSTPRLIQRS